MTHDTLHMTCDAWHMVRGELSLYWDLRFDHVKVSAKPFWGIQTGWVKLKFYGKG